MFFDKMSVSPQILTVPGGDFFFCSISPSLCENLFPDNPSALCAGRYSDLKSSLPNSPDKKGDALWVLITDPKSEPWSVGTAQ